MTDDRTFAYELTEKAYKNGIKTLIVEKENYAYIKDPVFKIRRNRVIGEVIKAIVRLELEKDERIIAKLYRYLQKTQNPSGYWNEIHANYNQPSSLVTSIVGEAFILGIEKGFLKNNNLHKAKDYVLKNEIKPGYFLKSKKYTSDHLNVDATCGAFLAKYGDVFSHEQSLKAARRASERIVKNQFDNGAFPYTTNKGSYDYLLNVPCIHYQGVTMYYLSKIHSILKDEFIRKSLLKSGNWLLSMQKANGKFDWSNSGLLFAYYLSGAYAFAYSSYNYLSKWDGKYTKYKDKCLKILDENIDSLVLRWEKDSWITFPLSIPISFKTSLIGNYPFKHKLFRFGYGLYRQMARRKISTMIDAKMFRILTKIMNVKTSTIEPFNNYPDLFMTSELLDCLSYVG